MSDEKATLNYDGKSYDLNVIEGTEGEKAFDIRSLRNDTGGMITMDTGFMNTGSCMSEITFIDGEKGILRYRGIPIEQLCEKSDFVETSYLLLHGKLPNQAQRELNRFSMLHEDLRQFLKFFPYDAHPMNILSTMVNALSSFYPNADSKTSKAQILVTASRLISKIRTIAAFAYKKSVGKPVVFPRQDLSYCENFLNMMFSSPVSDYELDEDEVKALNILLILHADHEQNCSTSTVRIVGSSQANLYTSISSGICALWGPLHGGANQAVMEMLTKIDKSGDVQKFIDMAKDKENNFRLSGFGHRVYKNYDPRARIIKDLCNNVLDKGAGKDPLLETAMKLEEAVLKDDYFVERKLYPNVDFYSGLLYKAMGFPVDMYTVLFAIGRLPGWIAHWIEMCGDPNTRIGRPRQIYTGKTVTDYVEMDKRR